MTMALAWLLSLGAFTSTSRKTKGPESPLCETGWEPDFIFHYIVMQNLVNIKDSIQPPILTTPRFLFSDLE